MSKTVVSYVSGHGFGHAVRTIEVLRALRRRRPDLDYWIRTPAPRWFFDFNLGDPFCHASCRLDVGAVQTSSLEVDPQASLAAYADLLSGREALIDGEVAALGALSPALVFADIPALAFDVAARLGVPGVAMTNFSWDWIYADYVRDFPVHRWLVDDLRESYGQASLLLRLPMHGDLGTFPVIRDIPLVARRARIGREEVRRRLGLPARRRVVLLSFGGIGLTLGNVPDIPGVTFVAAQSIAAGAAPCRVVSTGELEAAGARYEDLVGASDAVMTKPGYGIVAECIANGTAIVYTPRGRFAEYDVLVEGIRRSLPHARLGNADLYAGRWRAALEEAFAAESPAAGIAVNGAEVAAGILSDLLDEAC